MSAAGLDSLFGTTAGAADSNASGGAADAGGLDMSNLMDFDMSSMDFSGLDMNLGAGELDLDELLRGFEAGQADGSGAT